MRREDPRGSRLLPAPSLPSPIGLMHENGKKRIGAALDCVPTIERNGMTAERPAVAAIRG